MTENLSFPLDAAHHYFAKSLNEFAWQLLRKVDRTLDEDELMLNVAHASAYHAQQIGSVVHQQRGEWLIARVNTVLGRADAALHHARRCLSISEQACEEVDDVDCAYAFEAMARANALAGNREVALRYFAAAREVGQVIDNDEDRQIFLKDFQSGNWFNLQ